jgi:hypothetical protein
MDGILHFWNQLDSPKTKLLKLLIFLSTTNSFHQIISKKAKIPILFLWKNNNIVLGITI